MKYAVIDIETTGLSSKNERITEIAVFIYNGKEIIDEFITLVNPEKKIPYRIIQMTGINNQMVENAPKFYEVAKKIVEITQDAVFVGHNVRFDYGFVRMEFQRLGYAYERETIDTVRLSRKLIPGQPSYSLGKLCNTLGINNNARHRAAGDALATLQLFELLQTLGEPLTAKEEHKTAREVNRSLTSGLPEKTGVYYFYNSRDEIIYVGKSVNIKERVLSHLNNHSHHREQKMKNQLSYVDYIVTGSELVALLLESEEIKKHQPVYNQAQKRAFFNYGLYQYEDEKGYYRLKLNKLIEGLNPVFTYGSMQEARDHLFSICEEFSLCQKLSGLYNSDGSCFQYQIHQCNGACMEKESPEDYNSRVKMAMENFHFKLSDFMIIDKGRNEEEKAVVVVRNGKYIGFDFFPNHDIDRNAVLTDESLQKRLDNKEVRRIILNYMKKKKEEIKIMIQ